MRFPAFLYETLIPYLNATPLYQNATAPTFASPGMFCVLLIIYTANSHFFTVEIRRVLFAQDDRTPPEGVGLDSTITPNTEVDHGELDENIEKAEGSALDEAAVLPLELEYRSVPVGGDRSRVKCVLQVCVLCIEFQHIFMVKCH